MGEHRQFGAGCTGCDWTSSDYTKSLAEDHRQHVADLRAGKPRLLETHGCQGGAHAGYVRAGWDVTGVDIDRRHARYYPGQLIIADAAGYIAEHGHEYDAIHTSPPCQWYTRGNAKGRATGNSKWSRTIPAIREALELTGRPYIIENVTDAGWDMRNPIALCGCMFGLSTIDTDGIRIHLKRERLFETNWPLTAPRPCNHDGIEWWAGAYGGARRDKYEAKYVRKGGYVPPDKATVKALLGVEHNMTWGGLFECLPPAFTHPRRHPARRLPTERSRMTAPESGSSGGSGR